MLGLGLDLAYKYATEYVPIVSILGGDDPANAAEPDATAWILMDGPLPYNTPGNPNSGFVGGASWRKMAPSTSINDKPSYASGDERVQWDGDRWSYFNIYDTNVWSQLGASVDGEAAGDQSGTSVSMNAAGDRMVVGAPANVGTGGSYRGHVRVYQLTSGSWVQLGLDIDGEASVDGFGYSVSMNDAGDRIAIGAYLNDGTVSGSNRGHVRVYELINNIWTKIGLDIDGVAANDQSGLSVSMNAAGDHVAIGAPTYKYDDSGQVRIFKLINNVWTQLGLDILGEGAGGTPLTWEVGWSGFSVSINAAGDRVAIGAVLYNGVNGMDSGNVRVYQWSGSSWTLMGQMIQGEAENDQSGWSVSLNAAGDRVAIGTPYNDENGLSSGHVRIYEWNGSSSWVQLGSDINGRSAFDESGWSVSMNAAGNRVAIGARIYYDGGSRPGGYVRVYELIDGSWQKLDIDIEAEGFDDENGFSVSLNAAGDRVAIGAPYNDGINGADSGSVRVFEYIPAPLSTSSDNVAYPWLATWSNNFAGAKVTASYEKSTNYPAVP